MKIDLIISADDIKKEKVIDKSIVVIDMLRATSVIVTAMNNGCKEVIPVITIEEALSIANKNKDKYILGGERKALKIEGFDCSNSPLEYTPEVVLNKTLVMTTSNGTRAIKGSEGARNILIGALINANAVAKRLIELNNDIVIVNAGTYGQFSIDDFMCSGYIIDCILKSSKAELTDISKTAHYTYKGSPDLEFIKFASHFKRIEELNLYKDLKYCCNKDIIDIVPEYKEGSIKLYINGDIKEKIV
ncbi:2-phosphosulfolactate phosphatase [Clostridium tetanomorphum]|uniref:Probable 2-phosphosulfolactate phosphatase n=1 Tax=Clostridium tetanomorphum TaxID=1553 RepID=A0A923J2C2_CLOTT|nr:2-phosphosulfolactate phosphatase family protein [Clostridium tetanomorphum]KAJ50842.1 2-phosphosulfolactate phosphatase [Clostridium tetanomorphum DSM 665]MBC2398333.1 2-phosphosulfolactate phosphatase family protein [Clostridium tetanomorphum]MBP1865485.1 2-phosphosulfolactate phosphatase [Clostridium tetanomorphum]NRS86431.1 2-phosphosulfolactate phosphatase [Clostridium tetanomorphum]NRZ95540.1 2-phosphosulfolactate phosphatase [Clostridium tetanomorphum]